MKDFVKKDGKQNRERHKTDRQTITEAADRDKPGQLQ